MGGPLTLPKGGNLAGTEGLVLRVCGDGQPYTVTLTTGMLPSTCIHGSLIRLWHLSLLSTDYCCISTGVVGLVVGFFVLPFLCNLYVSLRPHTQPVVANFQAEFQLEWVFKTFASPSTSCEPLGTRALLIQLTWPTSAFGLSPARSVQRS